MKHWRTSILVLIVAVAGLFLSQPQVAAAQSLPVVEVVLFHSPTCPHCHFVIESVLPPLEETYGDRLNVSLINVQETLANRLFERALAAYEVEASRQGVPLMIVADEVLVGSAEIPDRLPALIDASIAQGGSGLPAINGLETFLASQSDAVEVGQPDGFGLAAAVFAFLVVSLGFTGWRWWSIRPKWHTLSQIKSPTIVWLAILGLAITAYLSYVELTSSAAICGTVGNCDLVQQSEFAKLFGIPLAFIGLGAYATIGIGWLIQMYATDFTGPPTAVLLSLAVISALFSVYLTSVELFVIHAVCMWCLGSAIVAGGLLLVISNDAMPSVR